MEKGLYISKDRKGRIVPSAPNLGPRPCSRFGGENTKKGREGKENPQNFESGSVKASWPPLSSLSCLNPKGVDFQLHIPALLFCPFLGTEKSGGTKFT